MEAPSYFFLSVITLVWWEKLWGLELLGELHEFEEMPTISIFLFLSLNLGRAKLVLLIPKLLCKETSIGTSLVVQWLRFCLPVQGLWVWSLVRELGSHMPQSVVQNNNNNNNNNICRNTGSTNYSRFILPITHIPWNDALGIFRKKIKQESPGGENKRGVKFFKYFLVAWICWGWLYFPPPNSSWILSLNTLSTFNTILAL